MSYTMAYTVAYTTYSASMTYTMTYTNIFRVRWGLKADTIFDGVVSALVDEEDRFVHPQNPQTGGVAQSTCDT